MSADALNMEMSNRLKQGKKASIIGIFINLMIFVIKIIIGISVKSVALVADAVNNFTDAVSSGISFIGFNISAKPADDEHPFGHGRMEDITSLIVAVIVTAIGLDFGKSAIEKIISPANVEINMLQGGFIILTIFMKFGLFFYFRYVGKKVESLSLLGAAFDCLSDILGTAVVLTSMICGYLWGWHLDGWATLIVAAVILRGGIGLVIETANPLIGGCPDTEIVEQMKKILMNEPKIHGIHDIILHSYGHERYFATAHAELSEKLSSIEAHDILEQAEINLSKKLPITLVLHCDPFNTDQPEVKEWRVKLENIFVNIDDLFKLYDFKMKEENGVYHFYFHLLSPRKYLNHEDEIRKVLAKKLEDSGVAAELHITFVNSYV